MSDTPVVVDRPRKGVYVGDSDGDGGRERRHHKHRSLHACGNLLSRLLSAATCVAGLVLMLMANQTSPTPDGYFTATWDDFSAYKWLVIANSVVFVYAILSAIAVLLSLCLRRGPYSYTATTWLMLVLDFLASLMCLSAAASSLNTDLIARNSESLWPNFCNYTSRFCNYAQGAIIGTFIGTFFMAQSTIFSASALRYLAH